MSTACFGISWVRDHVIRLIIADLAIEARLSIVPRRMRAQRGLEGCVYVGGSACGCGCGVIAKSGLVAIGFMALWLLALAS